MPDVIYLDPDATDANVIRIGGKCYYRVGPSDQPPMAYEPDEEFEDCEDCERSSSSSSGSEGSEGSSGSETSSSSEGETPCEVPDHREFANSYRVKGRITYNPDCSDTEGNEIVFDFEAVVTMDWFDPDGPDWSKYWVGEVTECTNVNGSFCPDGWGGGPFPRGRIYLEHSSYADRTFFPCNTDYDCFWVVGWSGHVSEFQGAYNITGPTPGEGKFVDCVTMCSFPNASAVREAIVNVTVVAV